MNTVAINENIRYFKPNDPYYYEVDNLPLIDLVKNDVTLAAKVNELVTADQAYTSEEFVTSKLQTAIDPLKTTLDITDNSTLYTDVVSWATANFGTATTTSSLEDINISNIGDDDILAWDSTQNSGAGAFINRSSAEMSMCCRIYSVAELHNPINASFGVPNTNASSIGVGSVPLTAIQAPSINAGGLPSSKRYTLYDVLREHYQYGAVDALLMPGRITHIQLRVEAVPRRASPGWTGGTTGSPNIITNENPPIAVFGDYQESTGWIHGISAFNHDTYVVPNYADHNMIYGQDGVGEHPAVLSSEIWVPVTRDTTNNADRSFIVHIPQATTGGNQFGPIQITPVAIQTVEPLGTDW
jgi:hypothetical protein